MSEQEFAATWEQLRQRLDAWAMKFMNVPFWIPLSSGRGGKKGSRRSTSAFRLLCKNSNTYIANGKGTTQASLGETVSQRLPCTHDMYLVRDGTRANALPASSTCRLCSVCGVGHKPKRVVDPLCHPS